MLGKYEKMNITRIEKELLGYQISEWSYISLIVVQF